mgnify:CR=1 FL=1
MVCLDFRRVAPVTVISGPSSNPPPVLVGAGSVAGVGAAGLFEEADCCN